MSKDELKRVFSKYPTGVTVVTNNYADELRAVTVNSYTSLSLDPPLILFNLKKNSHNLDAFINNDHFVVNILAHDQKNIANICAQSRAHKLAELKYSLNQDDIPLISEALANIECAREDMIAVGDHYIIIGRVLRHNYDNNKQPLIYFNSAYIEGV